MSDLALDDAGDLLVEDGDLQLVLNEEYVRQSIAVRLKHFTGEWFRDQNLGTDWYGQILGDSSDLSRRAELRRRILGTSRVATLTRLGLALDAERRVLTVDFEAQLDSGAPVEMQMQVTV